MNKLTQKLGIVLTAVGLMIAPFVAFGADFDASDTQTTLTNAIGAVTPTLKYGIGAILLVGLSIWAIFFVVGKLKKHVK